MDQKECLTVNQPNSRPGIDLNHRKRHTNIPSQMILHFPSPIANWSALPLCVRRVSLFLLAVFGFNCGAIAQSPLDKVEAQQKPIIHSNSLGMTFREIPGTPVLLSVYETRVADWAAFLSETKYDWAFKPHFAQGPDHPVVNTNVQDAIAFCTWLTDKERNAGKLTPLQSYRLPTNKEWDAAVGLASGRVNDRNLTQKVTDEQSFPWGLEWPPPPNAGNFNFTEITGKEDGYVFTAPVGQFQPNADGFYDLAGNAWEWARDLQVGADVSGTLRGGSWMYFRKECLLSSYRYHVSTDLRAASIGFRCIFEDKHRTAAFLAGQEKTAEEREKKQRDQLLARPDVSAEDIAKMREQLNSKKDIVTKESNLPDLKDLKLAQSGKTFLNSLGMTLRPAGTENVLFCETETRLGDYEVYLLATKRTWERKPTFAMKPSSPMLNVTWQESKQFCEWLTERDRKNKIIPDKALYRLPTDAEWSAAVGLTAEKGTNPNNKNLSNKADFPWGKEWPPPISSANLNTARMEGYQDSFSYTAPAGSFSPNSYHLFDLAGNVAEWCEDEWPETTGERVVRGGSWLSFARDTLLSSARQHLPESAVKTDIGFRCVLELPSH